MPSATYSNDALQRHVEHIGHLFDDPPNRLPSNDELKEMLEGSLRKPTPENHSTADKGETNNNNEHEKRTRRLGEYDTDMRSFDLWVTKELENFQDGPAAQEYTQLLAGKINLGPATLNMLTGRLEHTGSAVWDKLKHVFSFLH